jgi:conjugal transfer ATP-binding protein TraC
MELISKGLASLSGVWQEKVLGKSKAAPGKPAPVRAAQRVLDGQRNADIHDVAKTISGLHNILKYDIYDEELGLFYNDNSVSFCFEVIPQTGADEEMAEKLARLFTPMPPGCGIQWVLFGSPCIDQELDAYVDARHIAVDNGLTSEFFVDLAKRRVEHINRRKGGPLLTASNFMVKRARLLFCVTRSGSSENKKLCEEMVDLKETLRSQLRTAGLPSFQFDASDLLNFLQPILHPALMFSRERAPDIEYDDSRSIKEQVTPFGHHVRAEHDEIVFGLPPRSKNEPDSRISVKAFGIKKYPMKRQLWQMINVIGSFFDGGLQYPCPFLICGAVFTLDPLKVNARAMLKAARAKQNAKSKMAEYQPELSMEADDWNVVVHQLNGGGSMAEIYHTMVLFAPRKLMPRAEQAAVNIWGAEKFEIGPLDSIHLPLLYASLPMTLTEAMREDLKKFRVMSTKTTVNAVDMAPVISEWSGAGDPVMMFFGRRGTPTFLDFYSNAQGNYNVFVAGTSGSGKSVAMNEIVSSYRGIGARVWVIDVGRSYKNLISLQRGTFLEFTTTNPICINPFSWVGADSDIDFKDELRMLKPMVGRMASPNAPLSEFQYALIGEAIQGVWKDYGRETNPTLIRDYLLGKVLNERGQPERVAYELAKQLHPFTVEGEFGRYFNGEANINLDGDMVGLELEELRGAPDLRRVVLFVLTSRIAHEMYLTRDRKKICLVDEAWQLLGADKETAEFIGEGYRRARKYNGIFAVGTQGIQDAFANDAAQAAYSNADWKIFLRQDQKSLDKLIQDGVVSFTPGVKRMLSSLQTEAGQFSEMLISSPNGEAVVRHIPDPFSLLMASSKAADFNEVEALMREGYSTLETLQIMLKRRGSHA